MRDRGESDAGININKEAHDVCDIRIENRIFQSSPRGLRTQVQQHVARFDGRRLAVALELGRRGRHLIDEIVRHLKQNLGAGNAREHETSIFEHSKTKQMGRVGK